MIPVTAERIEKFIRNAEAAGVPDEELEELREHLEDIKSGRLTSKAKTGPMYKEITTDTGRIVSVSTAPIPEEDDDFEGVTFKTVFRSSIRPS